MAPPLVIDYLIAHEVAHLKEMNHGPKFWSLCEELCRNKTRQSMAQKNGAALQSIPFLELLPLNRHRTSDISC